MLDLEEMFEPSTDDVNDLTDLMPQIDDEIDIMEINKDLNNLTPQIDNDFDIPETLSQLAQEEPLIEETNNVKEALKSIDTSEYNDEQLDFINLMEEVLNDMPEDEANKMLDVMQSMIPNPGETKTLKDNTQYIVQENGSWERKNKKLSKKKLKKVKRAEKLNI